MNYHLGLTDTAGGTKPALSALRLFNTLFGGGAQILRPKVSAPANSQAVVYMLRRPDHQLIVVAWLRSPHDDEVRSNNVLPKDTRVEQVTLPLPCSNAELLATYSAAGYKEKSQAQVFAGTLRRIPLRGEKTFIAQLSCASHN